MTVIASVKDLRAAISILPKNVRQEILRLINRGRLASAIEMAEIYWNTTPQCSRVASDE